MFDVTQHDENRALTIIGELDEHAAVFDLPIRYGVGRSAEESACNCHETPFREMISEGGILAVKRVAADAEKDGENIVGGEIVAAGLTTRGGTFGYRNKKNMIANCLVMYDLDTGEPLQPVIDLAIEHGYCAYIYTTFSHNKTVTFINESKIEAFRKKSQRKFEKYTDAIEAYFREHEKVSSNIAESLVIDPVPVMMVGGQHYKVEHAPWPKYRIIFVLEEPFKMAGVPGVTQLARAAEWSTHCAGFGRRFGIDKFDKSCVDASRLMYTARIPENRKFGNILEDPDAHGALLVCGKPVPLADFTMPLGNEDNKIASSRRSESPGVMAVDSKFTPITPNLKKFAAIHGSSFRPVDWMRRVQEDHEDVEIIRKEKGRDFVEYECPNVDMHTGGRRDSDSPAWVSQSEGGWGMGCRTDGCGELYQGDRLRALDDFIQNTLPDGPLVEDAMELAHWCDLPETQDERTIDEMIAELQPEDTIVSAPVQNVIQAISKLPEWEHGQHAKAIKAKTDCSKGDIDKAIKGAVKKAKASARAKQNEIPTPDTVDLTADHLHVYTAWGKQKLIDITTNYIIERQQKAPTVFRRYDNAIAEIVPTDPPTLREMDRGHMKAFTYDCVTAIKVDKDGNRSDDFVDARVADTVWNSANVLSKLPLLRSLVSLPVYGANGRVITERGYNPDTETYFAPSADFLPVSDKPTKEEVDEALAIFFEATRDFPFSDDFSGQETLPAIYTDEPVEGAPGFCQPNLDRGYSSRLNVAAAMLTPFARNLIPGPCPVFLIDKPTPNTGATIMLKLMSYTINGSPETMKLFPSEDDEFSKVMLPDLLAGKPLIMYDNISHKTKIDSSFFAGVVTSGNFEGRKLGQSLNVTCPVSSIFVMAGNNISASGEVTRRMIPIRLDARTPHPGERRALFNMDVWARGNRTRLVWAMLTLIQNWIANGRPRFSGLNSRGRNLSTFEGWVSVIGGILEASGHERGQFLIGYDRYIAVNLESLTVDQATIEWIFETFDYNEWRFTTKDFKSRMYSMAEPAVEGFEPMGDREMSTTRGIKLKLQQLCNVFTIGEHEVRLTIDGRRNGWRLVRNDGGDMKEVTLPDSARKSRFPFRG